MLVISSREFRQNQRLYFDKVDQGEQIIVQRGKDKSYALMPVKEDDLYLNTTLLKRISESLEQIEDGRYEELSSSKDIQSILGL